jgi:pimeloyl-ACP methyl ester carboxylesterase
MDAYLYDIPGNPRGSDAWIAEHAESADQFADACQNNTGALLQHVDTVSAARDLDMLRAALGDDQLHYLGYSYGTYLGANYAELFPHTVGRLVLDGAIDPTASNFDVNATQAQGFENALRAYLTHCLAQEKCPFSGNVDEAMLTIRALLDSVDTNPIRASDGRELGATTLTTAVIYPLYQKNSWPLLNEMFTNVMNGGADTALLLADTYNGRNADGTYRDNSNEAFTAVNCLDYRYNNDPTTMRQHAALLEEIAPVIGTYLSFGDIQCANWPYMSTVERRELHAAGSAPILVVGTTNDPATPFIWAEKLAQQLDNARLVTYHGEGHTAYNKSNKCVNNAVDNYLVSGTVPSSNLEC